MNSNRLLIHCITADDIEALKKILDAGAFDIVVHTRGEPMPPFEEFGAIFCVARSHAALQALLADERPGLPAEEWVLIDSDEDDDFHCVALLTDKASFSLKAFVRALWARFQVP